MKSMTAFVSGVKEFFGVNVRFELASYNSRFIDINLDLPEFLLPYRVNIYNAVKSKLSRGRIELQAYIEDGNFTDTIFYQKIMEEDLERLRKIKDKFNLKGDIDISLLMRFANEWGSFFRFNIKWEEIAPFLDNLLLELNEVKEREGEFIKRDLENKIKKFKEILDFILSQSGVEMEEKKEKIMKAIKRLNELDIQISYDDINFFAFKDIDEELVRLESHVDYFMELLKSNGAVGKKLKFLLQEMAREVNTIGSKAYTANIVHKVIDLKEILDELREQVENIE
ncbi:MAG: DUF1732 domain-containing protein [candidate division WOR-3 bacterium]